MGHAMSEHLSTKPVIATTTGDAAGIGPEIVIKALCDEEVTSCADHVLIGDLRALTSTADALGISLDLREFPDLSTGISVRDLANLPREFAIGRDDPETGRASAENIVEAVDLWRKGAVDAICTAPISKKAINLGGYDFPGHTEFLAQLTGTRQFAMSFFAGELRVVLLSTHVSLLDAIDLVRTERLVELIGFTNREIERLLGRPPSIAVAGLNPHASEDGKFGGEEAGEISPAISECRNLGIDVTGPYSPDTIFLRGYKGDFDVVVALYHDQATIAVKSLSFGSGVNVTLGLPLIRTSVDHGTAYDIAGRGIADPSSMKAAMMLAADLVRVRK